MIVRYWNPVREADMMRRQLDRVFNELTDFSGALKTVWTPAANLVDQGNNYILKLQLPGLTADEINIQVAREAVIISGERKAATPEQQQTVLYSDFRYGPFRRVIALPDPIQNSQVEADFDNGVLILTLPKVEEAQNKVFKINLGELNKAADSTTEVSEETTQRTEVEAV